MSEEHVEVEELPPCITNINADNPENILDPQQAEEWKLKGNIN